MNFHKVDIPIVVIFRFQSYYYFRSILPCILPATFMSHTDNFLYVFYNQRILLADRVLPASCPTSIWYRLQYLSQSFLQVCSIITFQFLIVVSVLWLHGFLCILFKFLKLIYNFYLKNMCVYIQMCAYVDAVLPTETRERFGVIGGQEPPCRKNYLAY